MQPLEYESSPMEEQQHMLQNAPTSQKRIKACLFSVKSIEIISCVIIGVILIGLPELCIPLSKRAIPYQITKDEDILLDLTKYQEWAVETISCKILFKFYNFS